MPGGHCPIVRPHHHQTKKNLPRVGDPPFIAAAWCGAHTKQARLTNSKRETKRSNLNAERLGYEFGFSFAVRTSCAAQVCAIACMCTCTLACIIRARVRVHAHMHTYTRTRIRAHMKSESNIGCRRQLSSVMNAQPFTELHAGG